MRTIDNSEFMAHPEIYFDMARDGDVRITRGRQMFRLVCEAPHDEPFDEQTGDIRTDLCPCSGERDISAARSRL